MYIPCDTARAEQWGGGVVALFCVSPLFNFEAPPPPLETRLGAAVGSLAIKHLNHLSSLCQCVCVVAKLLWPVLSLPPRKHVALHCIIPCAHLLKARPLCTCYRLHTHYTLWQFDIRIYIVLRLHFMHARTSQNRFHIIEPYRRECCVD